MGGLVNLLVQTTFCYSIFRAIETGKYVIRSSNNGMTAIINPLGDIEKKIDYNKDGFIDFEKRRDLNQLYFLCNK